MTIQTAQRHPQRELTSEEVDQVHRGMRVIVCKMLATALVGALQWRYDSDFDHFFGTWNGAAVVFSHTDVHGPSSFLLDVGPISIAVAPCETEVICGFQAAVGQGQWAQGTMLPDKIFELLESLYTCLCGPDQDRPNAKPIPAVYLATLREQMVTSL